MGTELFKQLRVSVMVAWVFAWNVLLTGGMWLGGGWNFESAVARIFLIIALLGTSGLALAIAYYGPVQSVTLRSQDNVAAIRKDLWFFVLLTSIGAVATVISFFAEK
jgi:hypothetical protein